MLVIGIEFASVSKNFSDSDILFVFPFYFIISGIVFYGYRINGRRTCPFVLFLLAITMFALLQSHRLTKPLPFKTGYITSRD
jgi:hypothetical protein